ncbi:MAG TPA: HAD family hydrolase [Candidatus Hydrogenedentes bacterium]|nr:HAD family hydrolase [Candidatus Hydrogenedentota bacterium]HIJ73243.1 HAD family hydrolase [Candidatus Hydrogenedentota bacterium]
MKTEMPEWFFFDCFGTLIIDDGLDEETPYCALMAYVPVQLGLYASEADFVREYENWRKERDDTAPGKEITLPERLRQIFSKANVQENVDLEEAISRTVQVFYENAMAQLIPAPGVHEMLQFWHGKVRMAVVSNILIARIPQRVLSEHGLCTYFDFILDSASLGVRKPGEKIYRLAVNQAGVAAEHMQSILFIGDNPQLDVAIPRRLGMRALLYSPGNTTAPDAGQEFTIRHWDEFRTIKDDN